jgi:crotonobetainyl-CoA:carnitine CoA-transferase CaiB-like acyl-CoA transferase
MSIVLADHLQTGELPVRHGSGVAMIVPYQAFEAKDGYMMVAAGNDNLFRRLTTAIDRPSLAEDPRFATNGERVVNRVALVAILSDIFKTETRGHWAAIFEAAGIPNGPINSLDQVIADAQTQALGQIQRQGTLSLVGLPLSFDGARPAFTKRAPALGEDNAAILD